MSSSTQQKRESFDQQQISTTLSTVSNQSLTESTPVNSSHSDEMFQSALQDCNMPKYPSIQQRGKVNLI